MARTILVQDSWYDKILNNYVLTASENDIVNKGMYTHVAHCPNCNPFKLHTIANSVLRWQAAPMPDTSKPDLYASQENERELGDNAVSTEVRDRNGGSSNYAEHKIQPWDIWLEYNLNGFDADIVKRVLRTKDDPSMTPTEQRILDYQKIKHVCDERVRQLQEIQP